MVGELVYFYPVAFDIDGDTSIELRVQWCLIVTGIVV